MRNKFLSDIVQTNTRTQNAGKKVGFIGEEKDLDYLLKQCNNIDLFEVTGICSQNEFQISNYNFSANLLTTNPFGLISKSDTLIIAKTDESSFNLMVESILNSKHVIVVKPWNLDHTEIDKLEKLSAEASVCVFPLLSFNNWELLEQAKKVASQPLQISVQYKLLQEQKLEQNQLQSLLFSIVASVFFLSNAGCRKSYLKNTKILDYDNSLLNLWFDFDNGCSADISLNFIAEENDFHTEIYLKENLLKLNISTCKLDQYDYVTHLEKNILQCDCNDNIFLHKLLQVIAKREEHNWLNIQSGNFRKIICEYLKVTEKLF